MELEVTWGRTIRFWWAAVWLAALIGMGAGFVIGFVGGVWAALAGHPEYVRAPWFPFIGVPLWIPLVLWGMRRALRKQYSDFRIVLLPVGGIGQEN